MSAWHVIIPLFRAIYFAYYSEQILINLRYMDFHLWKLSLHLPDISKENTEISLK